MEILKGVFRTALDLAEEKGTQEQKRNMVEVIELTAQSAGELDDFFTGVKKVQEHRHHSIRYFTNAMVTGIKLISQARSEINENENL